MLSIPKSGGNDQFDEKFFDEIAHCAFSDCKIGQGDEDVPAYFGNTPQLINYYGMTIPQEAVRQKIIFMSRIFQALIPANFFSAFASKRCMKAPIADTYYFSKPCSHPRPDDIPPHERTFDRRVFTGDEMKKADVLLSKNPEIMYSVLAYMQVLMSWLCHVKNAFDRKTPDLHLSPKVQEYMGKILDMGQGSMWGGGTKNILDNFCPAVALLLQEARNNPADASTPPFELVTQSIFKQAFQLIVTRGAFDRKAGKDKEIHIFCAAKPLLEETMIRSGTLFDIYAAVIRYRTELIKSLDDIRMKMRKVV